MMKKWNEHAKKGEWDEILKEADRIEKELGPDLEYPATDQEVSEAYERLMTRIKSEGLYEKYLENEDSNKTIPFPNSKKEPPKPEKPSKLHVLGKYAAMFAITLIGIFVLSMSSEANRQWVMRQINYQFSENGAIINNENGPDYKIKDLSEEEAGAAIEKELNIEVPLFFYRPQSFDYKEYTINKVDNIAILYYRYKGFDVTLYMGKGEKLINDSIRPNGELGKRIEIENSNLDIDVFPILEEGDSPLYIAAWLYDDCYYRFVGKMEKEEFIKIIEKVYF